MFIMVAMFGVLYEVLSLNIGEGGLVSGMISGHTNFAVSLCVPCLIGLNGHRGLFYLSF